MSAAAAAEAFPSFWNVLGQLTNTVVFFFSGAACVNFVWRSTEELQAEGYGSALAVTLWRLPVIFLAIMAVRMLLIASFSPMLNLFGAKLDWRVRAAPPQLPLIDAHSHQLHVGCSCKFIDAMEERTPLLWWDLLRP